MRDFLLRDRSQIQAEQFAFLSSGKEAVLLPCSMLRYNDKIKLAYFTDGLLSFSELMPRLALDDVCALGKLFLFAIEDVLCQEILTPEKLVLDLDSIYVQEDPSAIRLIYLPTVGDGGQERDQIYVRRVYAVLTELLEQVEGGDVIIRQIEYQREHAEGDFELLRDALDRRIPVADSALTLRSSDDDIVFLIEQGDFRIGSDPAACDGVIPDESIDAVHARIGWNGIHFFVCDEGSREGTFVNDNRIARDAQVPIGKGNVIRLAGFSFLVE